MTEAERLEAVRKALIAQGFSHEELRDISIEPSGHWEVQRNGEYLGTFDFMLGTFVD